MHLIGAGLQVQRFSPLSSRWKTWQHSGRHGAGGAESSASLSEGCQEKTGFQPARMRILQPTHTVTHFFQQGHTYSNKATPPSTATPWAKLIQVTTPKVLSFEIEHETKMSAFVASMQQNKTKQNNSPPSPSFHTRSICCSYTFVRCMCVWC